MGGKTVMGMDNDMLDTKSSFAREPKLERSTLNLPTKELGVGSRSSYYFTPPDPGTLKNLLYIGLSGHYYVDSQYNFSQNILEEVEYDAVKRNADGTYYSTAYGYDYNMNYLMIMPVSGTMMLISKEIYTFGSGQIAVFDRRKGNSYCALNDAEFYFLFFDGVSADYIVDRITEKGNVFSLEDPAAAFNIFRRIHNAADQSENTKIVHAGLLHQLLSLFAESREVKNTNDRIGMCEKHIIENYDKDLNIDELAKMALLSSTRFMRVFHERMGVTPYEYLLQVRFAVAQNLLTTTDESIKEIAFEVGFNSDTHFITMFKRRFGITPARFRKMQKENKLKM